MLAGSAGWLGFLYKGILHSESYLKGSICGDSYLKGFPFGLLYKGILFGIPTPRNFYCNSYIEWLSIGTAMQRDSSMGLLYKEIPDWDSYLKGFSIRNPIYMGLYWDSFLKGFSIGAPLKRHLPMGIYIMFYLWAFSGTVARSTMVVTSGTEATSCN